MRHDYSDSAKSEGTPPLPWAAASGGQWLFRRCIWYLSDYLGMAAATGLVRGMTERRFMVCETLAAIVLHLRELEPGEVPCYSGRKRQDAQTLCGLPVGWDTRIPLGEETCQLCIDARARQ